MAEKQIPAIAFGGPADGQRVVTHDGIYDVPVFVGSGETNSWLYGDFKAITVLEWTRVRYVMKIMIGPDWYEHQPNEWRPKHNWVIAVPEDEEKTQCDRITGIFRAFELMARWGGWVPIKPFSDSRRRYG